MQPWKTFLGRRLPICAKTKRPRRPFVPNPFPMLRRRQTASVALQPPPLMQPRPPPQPPVLLLLLLLLLLLPLPLPLPLLLLVVVRVGACRLGGPRRYLSQLRTLLRTSRGRGRCLTL
eukprot:Rmarinus@m.22214